MIFIWNPIHLVHVSTYRYVPTCTDLSVYYIWNPHTWKFRGIYLVYPRVMTIFVVRQGYTRYIPVI